MNVTGREKELKQMQVKELLCDFGVELHQMLMPAMLTPNLPLLDKRREVVRKYTSLIMEALDAVEIEILETRYENNSANHD